MKLFSSLTLQFSCRTLCCIFTKICFMLYFVFLSVSVVCSLKDKTAQEGVKDLSDHEPSAYVSACVVVCVQCVLVCASVHEFVVPCT